MTCIMFATCAMGVQDAHRQAQQLAADQGKSQRLQEALHSNIQ